MSTKKIVYHGNSSASGTWEVQKDLGSPGGIDILGRWTFVVNLEVLSVFML